MAASPLPLGGERSLERGPGLAGVEPEGVVGAAAVGEPAEPLHREAERPVRRRVELEISDGERPHRLAVVAVLQRDEPGASRLSPLRLRLQRHLEGDLHRRRSVVGEEHLAEVSGQTPGRRGRPPGKGGVAVGGGQQPLAQAHQRRAGRVGGDDVLERLLLVPQRRRETRMAVAERLAPPARDGVQYLAPVGEPQARPPRPHHLERREVAVVVHLAAGVPEHRQVAGRRIVGRPAFDRHPPVTSTTRPRAAAPPTFRAAAPAREKPARRRTG